MKPVHKIGCSGIRHLHIVHLPDQPGKYRIVLRCACAMSLRKGRYLYDGYVAALAAMTTKPLERLFTQKRHRPKSKPMSPLTATGMRELQVRLDAAWVVWWKHTICPMVGHESRL